MGCTFGGILGGLGVIFGLLGALLVVSRGTFKFLGARLGTLLGIPGATMAALGRTLWLPQLLLHTYTPYARQILTSDK